MKDFVLGPVPHSKVYLFGECYFFGLENSADWGEFDVENISVGSGSCSNFLSLLETGKVREQGIFFVGGSIHERHGWGNGQTLARVLDWFNTFFHDSVLVFCLVGPRNPREEHLLYNNVKYNSEKAEACDGERILSLDCTFDSGDASVTKDGLHIHHTAKAWVSDRIRSFLSERGFERRLIHVGHDLDRILLGSGYRSMTIMHGNNDGFFSVFNNDRNIKNYAAYGHEMCSKPGVLIYMKGRKIIVDRISNVAAGEIRFSEAIYVDSIKLEG